MGRLLENAFKNRFKGDLFENINNYDVVEVPIEASEPSWENKTDHRNFNVLTKTYSLKNSKFLMYFLEELYSVCDRHNHTPEIFIDAFDVTVTLYTKEINDVTDVDLKMSKIFDEIIEDVQLIQFGRY